MPSFGVAVGMIVEQRIDKAIQKTFNKNTRQDAYRLLSLSKEAGRSWLPWRRNQARRELDALIASNKKYWRPIANKLQKIVLKAGQLDGLQTIRIVH